MRVLNIMHGGKPYKIMQMMSGLYTGQNCGDQATLYLALHGAGAGRQHRVCKGLQNKVRGQGADGDSTAMQIMYATLHAPGQPS